MNNTPKYWNEAKRYLSKKDKVLSSLIILRREIYHKKEASLDRHE